MSSRILESLARSQDLVPNHCKPVAGTPLLWRRYVMFPKHPCEQPWFCSLCWLILYVNMIGLRDSQITGKTLFLGISMRVFLKKISIWSSLFPLRKRSTFPRASAAAAAKSLQLCPTLCDPIDGSPPGPAVPGILQARTLEWVAISSSNAWKRKVKVKSLSRVRLLATPWTAAYRAPPSIGFSRQEYWSGVPCWWVASKS